MADNTRPQFLIHCSVVILDSSGRILLVQEAKPASRGKWNLPGGHLDHGESLITGAQRELLEETHIAGQITSLLGIYQRQTSIRFVFNAAGDPAMAKPGDEILAIRWTDPQAILAANEAELVSPDTLRQITRDTLARQAYPLEAIHPWR